MSASGRPKADSESMQDDVPMQQNIATETEGGESKKGGSVHGAPRTSRQTPPTAFPSDSESEGSLLPAEAPVTKATLNELEVAKIVTNCKLRHDVNFDADLHFRPNLDGDRGDKKRKKADVFWNALHSQLEHFVRDRDSFMAQYGHDDSWCLPTLLRAVKEIMGTLIPLRDRHIFEEGLNVELLVQEFYRGVMDLDRLASWLSKILKSHCAPMRDIMVDIMQERISTGNSTGDLAVVVDGLRSLLAVLEAMKLDVANHQIRCLRGLLIEDTLNFEQKFFGRKIRAGRLDITPAKQWYSEATDDYLDQTAPARPFGDTSIFFQGLSQLLFPSSVYKKLPPTFIFDEDRILKMRADLLDMINLEVCMRLHHSIEAVAERSQAQMVLSALATREDDVNADEFDFNTPPTTSRPSSIVHSTTGSAGSSPRSSLIVPSYVQEQVEQVTKAQNLYNSLVAILESVLPSAHRPQSRWFALANSMAVQIFRFTPNASPLLHRMFEQSLNDSLCNPKSALFADVENRFHAHFNTILEKKVAEFRNLDGNTIFKLATNKRSSTLRHLAPPRDNDGPVSDIFDDSNIENMATRLAHLGILHWRVWGEMAYVGDVNDMSLDTPSRF